MLMCCKQALCEAARFEQCVAEKHRVPHTGPYGSRYVVVHGDSLYQHRIDTDAHHDKERLEAQSKQ